MPDEAEDLGNSSPLEGGEDFFSAIDEHFEGTPAQDTPPQQTTQTDQQTPEQIETAKVEAERARNEKGQFTAEEKAEKERVEKEAKEKQTPSGDDKDKQYPAEIKSPKAREHFDALKKVKEESERRASSAEAKVKQFEAQVKELQAKSGTAAPEVKVLQKQVQDLQAQLDEREKILSFKAVEETTPFKEGVTIPQNEAIEDLKEITSTYNLDSRKIDSVLREPNKYKRREMLEELTVDLPERSHFVKDDLRQAVDKYVKAEETAQKIFQNAKGMRDFAEQEKSQAEAAQALERQQSYQKANTEVEATLRSKIPEFSDEEWQEIKDKSFKIANFDLMPAKAKAGANFLSFVALKALSKLRASEAAHNVTKDIMAKRNGSQPSAVGNRSTTVPHKNGDGGAEFEEGGDPMKGLFESIDATLAGS